MPEKTLKEKMRERALQRLQGPGASSEQEREASELLGLDQPGTIQPGPAPNPAEQAQQTSSQLGERFRDIGLGAAGTLATGALTGGVGPGVLAGAGASGALAGMMGIEDPGAFGTGTAAEVGARALQGAGRMAPGALPRALGAGASVLLEEMLTGAQAGEATGEALLQGVFPAAFGTRKTVTGLNKDDAAQRLTDFLRQGGVGEKELGLALRTGKGRGIRQFLQVEGQIPPDFFEFNAVNRAAFNVLKREGLVPELATLSRRESGEISKEALLDIVSSSSLGQAPSNRLVAEQAQTEGRLVFSGPIAEGPPRIEVPGVTPQRGRIAEGVTDSITQVATSRTAGRKIESPSTAINTATGETLELSPARVERIKNFFGLRTRGDVPTKDPSQFIAEIGPDSRNLDIAEYIVFSLTPEEKAAFRNAYAQEHVLGDAIMESFRNLGVKGEPFARHPEDALAIGKGVLERKLQNLTSEKMKAVFDEEQITALKNLRNVLAESGVEVPRPTEQVSPFAIYSANRLMFQLAFPAAGAGVGGALGGMAGGVAGTAGGLFLGYNIGSLLKFTVTSPQAANILEGFAKGSQTARAELARVALGSPAFEVTRRHIDEFIAPNKPPSRRDPEGPFVLDVDVATEPNTTRDRSAEGALGQAFFGLQ